MDIKSPSSLKIKAYKDTVASLLFWTGGLGEAQMACKKKEQKGPIVCASLNTERHKSASAHFPLAFCKGISLYSVQKTAR